MLSIWKHFSKLLLRNLSHFHGFSQNYYTRGLVHLELFRPFASEVLELPNNTLLIKWDDFTNISLDNSKDKTIAEVFYEDN